KLHSLAQVRTFDYGFELLFPESGFRAVATTHFVIGKKLQRRRVLMLLFGKSVIWLNQSIDSFSNRTTTHDFEMKRLRDIEILVNRPVGEFHFQRRSFRVISDGHNVRRKHWSSFHVVLCFE